MNILSIQSHVAYGHVGNSAAVFALQRLGAEVWPVHTVQFSNHPGYGGFRGEVFDGELVRDTVRGIEDRGALARCDGVLSGYIGDAGIGAAIVDAVERVKHANPAALYCCDPVIGDAGPGVYVRDGIPQFLSALLVPRADIVTPNHFELEHLTGRRCATLGDALAAVAELHGRGPRIVVVTSLAVAETPAGAIDLLASDGTESLRVRTPRLPLAASGAGDLFTAMLLVRLLDHRPLGEALALAAASVYGILEKTSAASAREMLLIEAQDECVAPSHRFDVERIA